MKLGMKGVFLGVLMAVAVGGCGDPIAGHQTPVMLPPQIQMMSDGLADDTAFPAPIVARIPGTGQLMVNVSVENRTDHSLVLEYQYEFLSHGMQKQEWSGWMPLRIPQRTTDGTVQFKSMEAEVDDFRIRFRRAKVE